MLGPIELVDPTTAPTPARFVPAARPRDLSSRRVGLLVNGKLGSDVLLDAVGRALEREQGVSIGLVRRKPSAYQPAPPELLDELQRVCDLVVTGVGD